MTDRPAACPICGKPATPDVRPFCGTRCADIDLGRWLTGQYRVPGQPHENDEPGQAAVQGLNSGD